MPIYQYQLDDLESAISELEYELEDPEPGQDIEATRDELAGLTEELTMMERAAEL